MSLLAIHRLYQPYFTFQRQNLKQWILLLLLILGNVSQAGLLVLLNTFFSHFFGVLSLSLITYQILLRSVAEYLFVLFIYTLNAFANSYIAEKLTYHLYNRMSKSFLAKWFQSKVYYGGNFLGKNQVSNVATKLSHDLLEANCTLLSLTNNFLNTIFGFTVGIVGLWQLSIPLKFTLAGSLFVLPGYMMFAAVIYSLFYNFSVNALGQKLEKTISKQRKHIDEMEAKIHHIEKYAESIELLNVSQHENEDLLHTLRRGKIYHNLLIKLNAGLSFFFEMNTQLRFFVGTLLNIPQIITKTISIDHLFIVSDYFYRVVAFFTWRHDNFNEITTLNVLIEKLSSLEDQMTEWEKVNAQKN